MLSQYHSYCITSHTARTVTVIITSVLITIPAVFPAVIPRYFTNPTSVKNYWHGGFWVLHQRYNDKWQVKDINEYSSVIPALHMTHNHVLFTAHQWIQQCDTSTEHDSWSRVIHRQTISQNAAVVNIHIFLLLSVKIQTFPIFLLLHETFLNFPDKHSKKKTLHNSQAHCTATSTAVCLWHVQMLTQA